MGPFSLSLVFSIFSLGYHDNRRSYGYGRDATTMRRFLWGVTIDCNLCACRPTWRNAARRNRHASRASDNESLWGDRTILRTVSVVLDGERG